MQIQFVKVRQCVRQKQKKIDEAIKVVEDRTGRSASDEEIAAELGINEDEYYRLGSYIAEKRKKYNNLIRIYEADCVGYYSSFANDLHCKKWRGCQAGLQVIGIESNGDIKGCLSIHGEEFIEGNIRSRLLKDIWSDKSKFKYNRRFSPDMLTGICKGCKWGAICRGGCSEKAESYTGSLHQSPFCLYNYEKVRGIV